MVRQIDGIEYKNTEKNAYKYFGDLPFGKKVII